MQYLCRVLPPKATSTKAENRSQTRKDASTTRKMTERTLPAQLKPYTYTSFAHPPKGKACTKNELTLYAQGGPYWTCQCLLVTALGRSLMNRDAR